MTPMRRAACLALCAGLAGLAGLAAAQSERAPGFPAKPVRFIVPFSPGAGTDITARIIANALSDLWGRTILVDNRAGAGGNIGTELTARAAPDGYTFMLCTLGSHAITPARKKLPYDHIRDFTFVVMMGATTNVLVSHPSQPMKDIRELVAHAKANPGKLSYGSSGVGTGPQMSIEYFKHLAGVDIVHVAYKGAAPALNDVMGGQIAMSTGNLPGAILSAIRAGRVRGLGVTTAQRSRQAPEIPTFQEGGVKGYDVAAWYGICAPAGIPPAIVARLNGGFAAVLAQPDVRQRLEEQGIDVKVTTPAQFAAHVQAETTRWAAAVKAAGLEER
jgi:tripartite-type tricarboxylate transporter receptor subunit TctC